MSLHVLFDLNNVERIKRQRLFAPYHTRFLVRIDDLRQVKLDKISILLNIMTPDNLQPILREFIVRSPLVLVECCFDEKQQDCAADVDDTVVTSSIRAIGRCARLQPDCMQQCLAALMTMIKSGHGKLLLSC